jgi:hypothetical protein
VEQHHQTGYIDGCLNNGLKMSRKQSPSDQHDAEQPEAQVEDGDRKEELRGLHGQPARASQGVENEQNQRHQDPVQVQDPQYAPVEPDFREIGGRCAV